MRFNQLRYDGWWMGLLIYGVRISMISGFIQWCFVLMFWWDLMDKWDYTTWFKHICPCQLLVGPSSKFLELIGSRQGRAAVTVVVYAKSQGHNRWDMIGYFQLLSGDRIKHGWKMKKPSFCSMIFPCECPLRRDCPAPPQRSNDRVSSITWVHE